MSSNESYPQHVVTAVIVAHDGASWLPAVADALLDQTRPVQRIVAVDTGSRDRSGAVLASKFGQQAVFGMDRSTGYGAAVTRALAHRAANTAVPAMPGGPSSERIEWIWLLHDDCEPAPDALEQLLRGVAETSSAAVLGPKLREWTNREIMLEAGVALDSAARRVTGIEPREVDQGQHDGDRDTLAVSSAGMLVRRDVWEHVGGFEAGMGLFMEDIDFCWRVHAAGYRVRVITDAVAYHVQAATKHRRAVSVGRRARMLDRRNGLLTLLGNLPLRQVPRSIVGNVAVSALRITFFLLAKRLAAAMDEATALVAVLCHPIRLIKMRRDRARGRGAAYSRVRADLPAGRSARRLYEFAASALMKSPADVTGSHHASADPTDDDSLLEDNGLARRLLTSPALLTFLVLTAVALAAGRSLLGQGPLGGGSLVPAWGGASDLWRTYVQAFHPVGIGSTTAAPPWLAVIAALATVLAGKPWLAIDVIMIGCVPLAGMTAMLAVRRVTKSALVRVWASATYALLPVATGVIASGRFGSAVAFILLPLIVLLAGRIFTSSRQQANRAGWATGLLLSVAAAFVPLLWPIAFIACCLAAIVFRTTRPGVLRNLAVAALTAPVLLVPWTIALLQHPANLLLEAGLPQPGTPVAGLPAKALMLLSPGGPGLPPYWVTGGLVAAALAALFAGRRRSMITAGWGLALSGLLTAIVVSHLTVRPADGGPVVVWAGLPLAIAALGLLLAASVGADALGRMRSGRKGARAVLSGRGLWAALVAVVACSTPALAAVSWLGSGVSGPIHPVTSSLVPELVAVADGQSHQVRTLVLRESGGQISYLLLRGPSPSLADAVLISPASAQQALGKVVAELTTPVGGLAVNPASQLAEFDIGYVLVQAPVDPQLSQALNDLIGLRQYSTRPGYALWQLDTPPARVTLVEPNGTVVPIPSGPVGVSGAALPAVGGTLLLAEPVGGWSASVNGQPLAQVPSPAGAWAQAFRVPGGGGTLSIGHSGLAHSLVLLIELLAFLAVAGLALPGIHVAEDGPRAGSARGRQGEDSAGWAGARAAGSRGAGGSRAGGSRQGAGGPGEEGSGEDADDDILAGAGAVARRAELAAVASRPGSSRSPRGTRGKGKAGRSGRDRAAGRDRGGRGRAGSSGPSRSGAGGSGAAGRGAAGIGGAAGISGAGGAGSIGGAGALSEAGGMGGADEFGRTAGGRRPSRFDEADAGAFDRDVRGRDDSGSAGRSRDGYGRAGYADADYAGGDNARGDYARGADERDELGRDGPGRGAQGRGAQGRGASIRGAGGRRGADRDGDGRAAGARGGRGKRGRDRDSRLSDAAGEPDPRDGLAGAAGGRSGTDWSAPGRGGSGRHSAGLPDAWPYEGAASRDDASRGDSSRGGGRLGSAWPHADGDLAGDPRGAGAQDPAWSYGSDRAAGSRTSGEHVLPAPPARSFDDRRTPPGGSRPDPDLRPAAGRSPSGRSPSGSWPYPDDEVAGADHGSRSSGRSPSGQVPSDPRPYGDADRVGPESRGGDYRDREYGGAGSRGASSGGAGSGRAGSRGSDLSGGNYTSAADYGSTGGDGRTGSYGGAAGYGDGGDGYDRGYDSAGAQDDDEPRRSRWPSARAASERLGVSDRRGRRGRDDRAGRQDGRHEADQASAWSGAGGDALEPLPPIDGPRRESGRRSAWQPAADESDDRGHGRSATSQRWSAPVPDYEPEHEGDSW